VDSVYGPLFTGVSALISRVVGAALLSTRLAYQLLAVVALGVASRMVWRSTRSAAAVAFLAANPLMAMWMVNGGRNDLLVGVAVLGAVVLSSQEHDTAAGVVGGLGSLVKLTGLVGVVALVAATHAARGRGRAGRCAAAAFGVVAVGYAVAGTAAL